MAKAVQSQWRQLLGMQRNGLRPVSLTPLSDPTVTVGTSPTGVAITPNGARAYVTNESDNTVSVIDTTTTSVVATITVGTTPFWVAIDPIAGAESYVTNAGDNTVSVIDTATNTVSATFAVGTTPLGIAVTPDGLRAYVANMSDGTVSVVSVPSGGGIAVVNVGLNPAGVAITPDGTQAYVTNAGAGTVSVINTATNTVTSTVAVGTAPFGVAVNPAGTHAYVVNSGDGTVSVIDTATNTVSTTVTVGTAPEGVAVAPDGNHAYVANEGDNTVSVIDTSSNMVTFAITVGPGPFGVAVTPNGSALYVTNNSNASVSITETVPFPTTTVLVSTPDPSVFGQAKTLAATVTSSVGTPTGTVTFFDGGTPIGSATLDGSGAAAITVSTLAVGPHALTASYGGDGNFASSTSSVDNQRVNPADTTTVLTSGPDPSVFGQAKTLTATVTAVSPGVGTPTGTVTFFDGGSPIGSAALDGSGVATLSIATLAVGSHALTASYGGDGSFASSTSLVDDQRVNPADTTTVLTSGPDPSVFGQAKTLTATVTAVSPGVGTPTGTVTFFDGGSPIGSAALDGSGVARLTVSTLAVGSHALTASYGGDGSFNGSTSLVDDQTVNPADTSTVLTSAPDPSVFGQAKTLTATVTAVSPGAGTPTGTVTFLDGGSPIGSAALDGSGAATLTVSTLAVGSHALTAVYGGDGSFNGSTSLVDDQTVNPADTSTVLTSGPDPSVFGQAKTLTATVTAVSPGAGTASGTVDFFDGGSPIGSATLDASGVATLSISTLAVGSHALTAVYGGDGSFNGSTSLVDDQTVNPADTSTVLTSGPDPSVFGQAKTLTATVTAVSPGAGTASGTVDFFDGGSPIGSATLDASGVATLSISTLAVGSHALTAVYGGDGSFNGSTSLVDDQTVNPADTSTVLTSAPDPSVFGQAKTLTATVTAVSPGAGTASGTVDFFDGGSPIGSATLDASGVATLSISTLAVGPHALTAVYGGDGSFNGSTSLVDDQTVNPADTSTVLTSVPDPSVFGQAKTLTATVGPVSPGAGTPTGTVTFFDGGTPIGTAALVGGAAAITTTSLAVGPHALTAVYSGDGSFNGSTSLVDNQTVNRSDTSTELTSVPDPSVFGQAKTLTATVGPVSPGAGTPTGTVTFFDGGTPIGTAALVGGAAAITTTSLAAGPHALTAVYSGDGSFNGSTSLVDNQTVNKADTSTALTSSPDPSVFGQAKTLTATVTAVSPGAGTPTGTVTFFDGGNPIGTGTLDGSGVATFTTSALGAGPHALTAVYSGDGSFNGSTSLVDNQTVNKADTSTALTSSPDPSVFGQAKTLTATVTAVSPGAGTPTGTVTFFDGGNPIGTGTLDGSGVATFTTSALGTGSHALTAVYSGDGNFNGSTSPTDNQTVNKASTSTSINSAPNPSVFGQPVTLTATVTATAPGSGTPTGMVTFFIGGIPQAPVALNGSGVATLTTSSFPVGTRTVRATYGGNSNYTISTSPTINQTVNKANSVTSLTSAPDPSPFGQPKTLTATVTAAAPGSGTPTGTVSFFDGATLLGTSTLSGGTATFTASALPIGTHSLTAVYNGSSNFNTSTSPADVQTVTRTVTTTSLTSSPDPTVFGQTKTLTATVTTSGAGTPTGTVTFFDGGNPIGTATLNGSGVATLSVSNLSAGPHSLIATYNGDANFDTSTSPTDSQTVNKADTGTTLVSSPDPSVFGQTKALTATVTATSPGAGTPTGTITFFDGGNPIGTATLNGSGVATLSVSNLSTGAHSLTATYAGDSNFNGSTSPSDAQTVNKASTSTAVNSVPNPSVFGQPVTLTATVTATAPGAGTPTGSVTFFIGGIPQAPVALNGSGVATLTTSTIPVGTRTIRATYNGDTNFNSSTSATINQTVTKANSSTALTSAPNPSSSGQAVTLTASVTAVSPGAGTPTGTVGFFDGATLLGTGTLSGGTATFTTSTLTVGTHPLTATYNGSGNFNTSTSPTDNQTVTP